MTHDDDDDDDDEAGDTDDEDGEVGKVLVMTMTMKAMMTMMMLHSVARRTLEGTSCQQCVHSVLDADARHDHDCHRQQRQQATTLN